MVKLTINLDWWNMNNVPAQDTIGRDSNAHMLLHELGHVFDLLFGDQASPLYTPDYSPWDDRPSLWNDWKIDKECFEGKLGHRPPPGM